MLHLGNAFGSDGAEVRVKARVLQILLPTASTAHEALVEVAGNRVILTERRRPFHNLADFHRFGIEPATETMLVVKSGYLSPELAVVAKTPLMALTEGAVNQALPSLPNHHRPVPSWPFQRDFDWVPQFHLSGRAAIR
nr:MlrC C-terminal domain-containing protein [Falsirhodobacter sp. alg1]